jgi:PKD repeat protein
VRLILAILGRDLRQTHRHGLGKMVFLAVVLLLLNLFLFTNARSTFQDIGTPGWTGGIISEGEGSPGLVADIRADILTGPAPLTVTLTSAVSGGKAPYTYKWELGSQDTSTAASPTHTFNAPGGYMVRLRVTDAEGLEAEPVAINVLATDPANTGLQCVISVNVSYGPSPLEVRLISGVAGGAPPYIYSWDLGDGNGSTEGSPVHIYNRTGEFKVVLNVTDSGGNSSRSNELKVEVTKEGNGGLNIPFTLLDVTFGMAVLVTMVLVTSALSSCYSHEIKKGTVRTLVCYPVGVLEVTAAKLLYAALVGGILSGFVFLLPASQMGKPGGELLGIFLTAYLLTLSLVAVGALFANALTLVTRRMYIGPTSMPKLLGLLAIVLTRMVVAGIAFLLHFLGSPADPATAPDALSPLIALSPYHQGGALLADALGGPHLTAPLVLAIPIVLLAAGIWLSGRVYPHIYEKE